MNMIKRWKTVLRVSMVMLAVSLFFVNSCAAVEQEQAVIEAVGFFSHFPMRSTRQVIEEICAKFGGRVSLTLYDETRPEGQEFMASKNLSGHIPMRLYINGVNTFSLDGRDISFSDFVGYAWTAADLEKAITLALESGVDGIAVDAPVKSGGLNPIMTAGIVVGLIIIALTGFILFWPKKKQRGKRNVG